MARIRILFQRQFFTILIFLVAGITFTPKAANGQIVPDDTLGEESSTVRQDNIKDIDSDIIEGGATRDANLFHSFSEFNVDAGRGAYFANPDAIDNILSRVTGSNISEIMGTLGVLGDANLFLINPNGIVFGENARLDVGGSFFASTADSLLFANGFEFGGSNPEAPPLLTVNIPVGLGFRDNPGSIENQSRAVDSNENPVGLQMQPEKDIIFAGGDIAFNGGIITAPGGRVDLGGLAEAGTLGLNNDGSLSFPDDLERADLKLTNDASVNVRAGEGGFITVNADNIELAQGSTLLAGIKLGMGSPNTEGGDITINSTGSVSLTNGSQLSIKVRGQGNGGNVIINAKERVWFDGVNERPSAAFTTIREEGKGNAGDLEIKAGSLYLTNGAELNTSTFGQGKAGNISIDLDGEFNIFGRSVQTDKSSRIFSSLETDAEGSAGDISITADSFTIKDGGFLSNSTSGEGSAGNVTVKAEKAVEIADGSIFSNVNLRAKGNGGIIRVNSNSLSLAEGGQIQTLVAGINEEGIAGQGNAGNIEINIQEDVSLSGLTPNASGIISSLGTGTEGNAGKIDIKARSLTLKDGGFLRNSIFGNGNPGSIAIDVKEAVTLSNNGDIFSEVGNDAIVPEEKLGAVTINAGSVSITDEDSSISTSTSGQGNAGNITVKATDTVFFDNASNAQSRVEETAIGNGGNINIQARTLSLANGSEILAETFGEGKAGSIQVDASDSVVLSGVAPLPDIDDGSEGGFSSGLIAATEKDAKGQGGNISVNTDRLQIADGAVLSARSRSDFPGGKIVVNANVLEVTSGGQILTTAFRNGNAGNINLNISDRISLSGSDPTYFDRLNQLTAESSQKEAEFTIDPVSPESGIFANTKPDSTGNGGSVTAQVGKLSLDDGAKFAVNSEGTGNGGSIELSANNLSLNNNSEISAATASGEGGNIDLAIADILLLENNSPITTEAGGTGKGGDIKISADFTILKESEIIANAFKGEGGNINITTQGLFQRNSKIDASSELGIDGVVKLNTPEIDPSQGVVELPVNVQDPNKLIAQDACKQGIGSSLVVTGRGGLPPSSSQDFNSNWVDVDLIQPLPPENQSFLKSEPEANPSLDAASQERLIPAEGWVRNEKGEIFLVAYKSNNDNSHRQNNIRRCQPK